MPEPSDVAYLATLEIDAQQHPKFEPDMMVCIRDTDIGQTVLFTGKIIPTFDRDGKACASRWDEVIGDHVYRVKTHSEPPAILEFPQHVMEQVTLDWSGRRGRSPEKPL